MLKLILKRLEDGRPKTGEVNNEQGVRKSKRKKFALELSEIKETNVDIQSFFKPIKILFF
jgi:hypothetical protein